MAEKKAKEKDTKEMLPNMTPEEAAIYQRVKGEKEDWEKIQFEEIQDYSLMEYPFQLPDCAKKLVEQRKYFFRFVEKKTGRIDDLINRKKPHRWLPVNRDTFPDWPRSLFDGLHGGVQELDQIMMYQPYEYKVMRDRIKNELAELQARGGTLESRDGIEDKDRGVSWRSGEGVKITGKDEVMDPGNTLERAFEGEANQETNDFGDLIVDE
jgi:hypothetical protein